MQPCHTHPNTHTHTHAYIHIHEEEQQMADWPWGFFSLSHFTWHSGHSCHLDLAAVLTNPPLHTQYMTAKLLFRRKLSARRPRQTQKWFFDYWSCEVAAWSRSDWKHRELAARIQFWPAWFSRINHGDKTKAIGAFEWSSALQIIPPELFSIY